MRVGLFGLLIPEGVEQDSGHVRMSHGKQYSLKLSNFSHSLRCDAAVYVDGKHLGDYRVNAGCSVMLERSSLDEGRFTFFRADSGEAASAGVAKIGGEDRGLVRVVFKPERKAPPPVTLQFNATEEKTCGGFGFSEHHVTRGAGGSSQYTKGGPSGHRLCSAGGARGMSAGITGLTGKSSQQFYEVSALDYDPAGETTISLRLVADAYAPRELTGVPRANPTPAAVE